MKSLLPTLALRALLLGAVVATGQLTTSCSDDSKIETKDYAAIDDDIIKKYLAANSITTAQRQPSGLYYLPVNVNPTGVRATTGKTVSVYYTGQFMDGRIFDSSLLQGNTPLSFVLGTGRVIAGWDEGIVLMRKGEKSVLFIPSALAYGSRGAGSSIPPNTVLRFEVELADVR